VVDIRQADFPGDRAAVRELFDGTIAFLLARVPELEAATRSKYSEEKCAAAVDEVARIHVPPDGALLLAEEAGTRAGCGMMRTLAPGTVELQRIFVPASGRGRGTGRALTQALIERARGMGAQRVLLDTGAPLVEAIGLYRALGFREIPPYHDDYPALQPHLRFFELDLTARHGVPAGGQ
jgi:ribosomal protein S18 acetylase RimI-like enzyme